MVTSIIVAVIFLGAIVACFIPIIRSVQNERKYKSVLLNDIPYSEVSKSEPFPGALFVSSLLVYIYGTSADADQGMRYTFSKSFRGEWGTYCRAAEGLHTALNGDLLVERLVSALKKSKADPKLVSMIFTALNSAELMWSDKDLGKKPSAYMAELMNYSVENSEVARAYRMLGLQKNASMNEVKAAHRRMAAKYHPDRLIAEKGTVTKEDTDRFNEIQKAYETILNG